MQINLLGLVVYPMIGGLISYLVGRKNKKVRDYVADFVVVSEFLLLLMQFVLFLNSDSSMPYGLELPEFCSIGLSLKMDGFRALYGSVAAFMWMISTLFSREYFAHYKNRNRYYFFLLATLGATIGVFLSADLFTTFVFFEIASFTSYVWVAQDEKKESLRAAETYLAIAVIGGLVMLMGLFILYNATGTLRIDELREACSAIKDSKAMIAAGVCLFFGFGAKAGAVPLHVWLPKAHPVAPAPASALLSGILTKVGIFGILVVSSQIFYGDGKWGIFVLAIGVLTMLTGAILALLSIDLKRTLACSSVSQIGFILIGIGMQGLLGEENVLAVRGTLLYMINHSLFKLVLFLVAGVVFMNLHKLNLNDIKGYGRKKPLLKMIFLSGALGISGVPLFSGYISKTLLHESIVEYTGLLNEGTISAVLFGEPAMILVEWLFLISGGITLAYMMKLFVVIFIEKNNNLALQQEYDNQKTYMKPLNAMGLSFASALFVLMGILPHQSMDRLADMGQSFMNLRKYGKTMQYFSMVNLKGSLVSIGIGLFLYLVIVRKVLTKREKGSTVYINPWKEEWDLENVVYRPLLSGLDIIFSIIFRVCDRLLDYIIIGLRKTLYRDSKIPHELDEGTWWSHAVGILLDDTKVVMNHTIRKKKPIKTSFVHKLALWQEEMSENNTIIGRSLSFGLFMFCVGLVLTLVYMLWW